MPFEDFNVFVRMRLVIHKNRCAAAKAEGLQVDWDQPDLPLASLSVNELFQLLMLRHACEFCVHAGEAIFPGYPHQRNPYRAHDPIPMQANSRAPLTEK